MLGHINGYQHSTGGGRITLGHGRSVSKVLSRQLHFRDPLAGHGRLDVAGGRYAPLSPSRQYGPFRGGFPMCYGHEFQAKFHWHVEDQGIRHAYIKRGTPQLNGKVERSHRSDQQEFYQLLSYKGDVDLEAKLSEWANFYNFNRPHGAFNGKTPYEALRERL
jgi:Integrase core domain